jgi:hypothetical protein
VCTTTRHGNNAFVHQPPRGGGNYAGDHGEATIDRQPLRGGRKAATGPVQGHLGHNRDVRDTLNTRRRGRDSEKGDAGHYYNPRRGGHYDSGEDRSQSPPLLGPRVFSRHILSAPIPVRYRLPINIQKYSRETNPDLWLKDYRLACQAGGADGDAFIIRNLPLYLTDSARAWLEHLSPNEIECWEGLREIFVGNFWGTYVRPGISRTSRTTNRSRKRLSTSTSDASLGSATSSSISPMSTSSGRSY